MNKTDIRFTDLGAPRRIWAVSAIHGELDRLYALHDAILERLQAGDRIVYLGNFTGYGAKSRETVDEILTFRRLALSQPGVIHTDFVYLRGLQEDLWHKLLEVQFAHKPAETLQSILDNGFVSTLESYDISAHDGMQACREGVLPLTRWTNKIRETLRKNPAHDIFFTQIRRAAYTTDGPRNPLLFVNSGLNPAAALDDQGESFWKSGQSFSAITQAYAPFEKVIRGYDPNHEGVRINCVTASLDGGAGFGGTIICAGMDSSGKIQELMHA